MELSVIKRRIETGTRRERLDGTRKSQENTLSGQESSHWCNNQVMISRQFSETLEDLAWFWSELYITPVPVSLGILSIVSLLSWSDQFRFSQLSPAILPATLSSSELCIHILYFNKSLIWNVCKWNFIHWIEWFKVKIKLDTCHEWPKLQC